jgi:signal transduction histidine kinase
LLLLAKGGICQYASVQAARLLGLAADATRLPAAPWAQTLQADCEAARREGPDAGRYRSVAVPDGATARYLRWWASSLGERDLVLLLDVTPQQQAEEAARTLLNDLSHELRTPLATILTHLEVLNLPGVAEDVRGRSIALLREETRRMARLVHQMLELGRLETSATIERRPLDLLVLAEETVAQVGPQADERGIAMALEVGTPLPLALGDQDHLRRVLLNLLDNALKYSRTGDQVVLSLAPVEGGVRCAVRDSGPGIPPEHLPHLARRFYRAAPHEVEGSGLGLALVAEILRRHGSALQVESESEGSDTGTCVWFVLPTASPPEGQTAGPGGS